MVAGAVFHTEQTLTASPQPPSQLYLRESNFTPCSPSAWSFVMPEVGVITTVPSFGAAL